MEKEQDDQNALGVVGIELSIQLHSDHAISLLEAAQGLKVEPQELMADIIEAAVQNQELMVAIFNRAKPPENIQWADLRRISRNILLALELYKGTSERPEVSEEDLLKIVFILRELCDAKER